MMKDLLFTVIPYNFQLKNDWDNFVDQAKNAAFLFKRDFMEYHKDRFDDYSLLFYRDNELIGLLPACKENETVISHKGLTYGGLLVKNECRFNQFKLMFLSLLDYLKSHQIKKLVIKTLPSVLCEASNDELSFLYQLYGNDVHFQLGSVVYPNQQQLLSKSIIRNAKKALKAGIIVKDSDELDTFWNDLLIPRLKNRFNKKPLHSLHEIKLLKNRFPDEIQLVGVFLHEKMIAGTLLFNNKRFIKSQYIASVDEFNKLGGLDLLHFDIINKLKDKKFDFGTSMDSDTSQENSSLLAWKEQFGARTVTFATYTFII